MIYDYKLEELTQEVLLDCFCTLTDDIIDEYSSLRRYDHLSIYAPSSIAREILGRLLDEIEDLWVDADSRNELLYKNDNEVVITIACDGMVFVEDAKYDGIILGNDDCCLTYFYDGLSKKDLDVIEENAESILVFGFKEDGCECCTDENTELDIISNKYYVNGKEVSKQTWERERKLFNDETESFRRDFWNYWFSI